MSGSDCLHLGVDLDARFALFLIRRETWTADFARGSGSRKVDSGVARIGMYVGRRWALEGWSVKMVVSFLLGERSGRVLCSLYRDFW